MCVGRIFVKLQFIECRDLFSNVLQNTIKCKYLEAVRMLEKRNRWFVNKPVSFQGKSYKLYSKITYLGTPGFNVHKHRDSVE